MKHKIPIQSLRRLCSLALLRGCFLVLLLCLIGTGPARADINNAGAYLSISSHRMTPDEPYLEFEYPFFNDEWDDDAAKEVSISIGCTKGLHLGPWRLSYFGRTIDNVKRENEGVGVAQIARSYNGGWDGDLKKAVVHIYPNDAWNVEQLNNFYIAFRARWDIDDDNGKDDYWFDKTWNINALSSDWVCKTGATNVTYKRLSSGKIQINGTNNTSGDPSGWASNYAFSTNANTNNSAWARFSITSGTVAAGKTFSKTLDGNYSDTEPVRIYYRKYLSKTETVGRGGVVGAWNDYTLNNKIDAASLSSILVPGFISPSNLSLETDKFTNKVTVKWDCNHENDQSYLREGMWRLFRKEAGTNNYVKIADIKDLSNKTYIDYIEGMKPNIDYEYVVEFLPISFGDLTTPLTSGLAIRNTTRLVPVFVFNKPNYESTIEGNTGGIRIFWNPEYTKGTQFTLEKFDGANWVTIYEGSKTEYLDPKVSLWVEYKYRLKTDSWWNTTCYSEVFNATCAEITRINSVDAARGQNSNMVKIKWNVTQVGNEDTRFVVKRKLISADNAQTEYADIYETTGSVGNYFFEDGSAQPGQYYYYKVIPFAKNPSGIWVEGNSMETDGFCTSRGIISGRVTYGSGTAVKDVTLRISKIKDDEDNKPQFFSLTGDTNQPLLSWTPAPTVVTDRLQNKPFSLQMWVRMDKIQPADAKWTPLFSIGDNLSLNADNENGKLYLRNPSTQTEIALGDTVPFSTWAHITVTFNGKGSYKLYHNGTLKATVPAEIVDWEDAKLCIGGSGESNCWFKGNVDEIRFWTQELTEDAVTKNYRRILSGTEAGLFCYWPLDDGINGLPFAYDYSKTNGIVNNNHAPLGETKVSQAVPAEDQLSLYAITDEQGNYTLRGVPFAGDGTSYVVKPLLGIHSFSPQYVTRYVSANSLTHNGIDFEDISSFPVSGKVTYEGTNIPVVGANIYVDNSLASKEGKPVETNSEGEYTVDVPIGDHSIMVKMQGHEFQDNGRFPADPDGIGLLETFEKESRNINFTDVTKVVIAGRVVGGKTENDKPLGIGLSKANIGQAMIKLSFVGNESYKLNPLENAQGMIVNNPNRKDFDDTNSSLSGIKSIAYVEGNTNNLTIETDPNTGEFATLLPPLTYIIEDVSIPKQPDIKFNNYKKMELDATNPSSLTTDSATIITEYVTHKEELRKFEYCASAKIMYQANPVLEVKENNIDGSFGDKLFKDGSEDGVALYQEENGKINYLLGYPVFTQRDKHTFSLYGYELYQNKDEEQTIDDYMPLSGVKVIVHNDFADKASIVLDNNGNSLYNAGDVFETASDSITLDEKGEGIYRFRVGIPNIQGEHTRNLSITYFVDEEPYNWIWIGNEGKEHPEIMKCIVLGGMPKGKNFVTNGPDEVLMVLRDPPGSNSSTTWTKGSSIAQSKTQSGTSSIDGGLLTTLSLGYKTEISTGLLVSVTNEVEIKNENQVGFNTTFATDKDTITATIFTATKDISTSDSPDFVGAEGDVFIGSSKNIIVGACTNVYIKENNGTYSVECADAYAMSEKFTTAFNYSQHYVKNILIPQFKTLRNSVIQKVSLESLGSYPRDAEKPIYISNLDPSDPMFGTDNNDERWGNKAVSWDWGKISKDTERLTGPSYTIIFPKNDISFSDTITYFNNQIKAWEKVLYDNEEQKVYSQKHASETGLVNYSIDAGSKQTITKTNESHVSYQTTETETHNFHFSTEIGGTVNTFGGTVTVNTDKVNEYVKVNSNDTTTVATFSYTLADNDKNDYLSIDVFEQPKDNFGPIFYTRAGATSAPYEDEVKTEYFEKGTVIMEKTLMIEKPELIVENKEVFGVPAGKDAVFHITLNNNSETFASCYYGIKVVAESNPNGAQLFLDGKNVTEGIKLLVPYGSMEKTISLRQTDADVLDYPNIKLRLYSCSQPDEIFSEDAISVKFQPMCSDIILSANTSVVNCNTNSGVTFSMSGYDYNQASFKKILLQYRAESQETFTTLKTFVKTQAEVNADPQNTALFEPLVGTKTLDFTYDGLMNPLLKDDIYIFRAVTVGQRGNSEVTNQSEELRIVRDMSKPQLLGMPTPADGILTASDAITMTFNEDIRSAYLAKTNFVVKGKMNKAPVAHDVALNLAGTNVVKTDAAISLADKSFCFNMWLNYSTDGRLLQHGCDGNVLTLSIKNGILLLNIDDNSYQSTKTLPKSKWLYLSVCYDNTADTPIVNAGYGMDASTVILFDKLNVASYEGNGPISLGGENLTAMVNELSLWNSAMLLSDALSEKDYTKNQYSEGLLGYWPLNEAHGTVAHDKARSRHMTLASNNGWYVSNGGNYALKLDGKTTAINAETHVATLSTESYLVETWFRATSGESGLATILSANDRFDIRLNAKGALELGIQGTYTTVYTGKSLYDDVWHHVALNVRKSTNGSAVIYLDGQALRQFSASAMPQLSSDFTIGALRTEKSTGTQWTQHLNGYVDEFRVWKGDRSATVINNNIYNRVDTLSLGLVAYYPMEWFDPSDPSSNAMKADLRDQAGQGSNLYIYNSNITPAKLSLGITNSPQNSDVRYDFVANERQIAINLDEEPSRIENTNVDIIVYGIKDMNGNECDPIYWTIYVQQNQLRWSESEIDVTTVSGESETFSVEIANTGATSDNWFITGMPEWLSVNVASGVLTPLGTQKVRFTIDSNIPVGNYEAIIYLTGSQNIDAPLYVNLKVTGDVPEWNPIPDEEAMLVIGQLKIDDKLSTDPDDMIAAFRGQECVGVAHPVYSARNDSYFVSMTVYGNSNTAGSKLTYKVYDASNGTIYPAVSATNPAVFKFSAGSLVGTYANCVIFSPEDKIEQDLSLNRAGWKWFSMYVTPDQTGLDAVFEDAATQISTVKNMSSSALNISGTWVGTIDALDLASTYKLNATSAFSQTITGKAAKPADVDITIAGNNSWTWIGYPVAAANSLSAALAGADPQEGDIIMGQSAFALYFEGDWMGSLRGMTPGEGYKYFSTASAAKTFQFPTPAAGGRKARLLSEPVDALSLTCENNMALIAQVTLNGQPFDDAVVYVYADDELCGYSATADSQLRHFVTIGGTGKAAQLHFIVRLDDEEYAVPGEFRFKADAVIGDITAPYTIELNNAVDMALIHQGKAIARIEIYDASGILLRAEDQPAGMMDPDQLRQLGATIQRVIYADGTTAIFKQMFE